MAESVLAGLSDEERRIRDYAKAVLDEWSASPTWGPGRQLRALTFSNARDYEGRFLIELLQNGHDAHPRESGGGSIHVFLDLGEGPFGTLYVANGGRPFSWEQVESVCKIAQSAKTVGEGIGNKGVGFRSVLSITDAPEIYSARPDGSCGGSLDGFRFRFATPDDLRDLLDGRDELARTAADELPPFQVPYPLDEVPPRCAELGAAGHVTVIRLPLRNERATGEAVRRRDELTGATAPIMLFLPRLERLVLETREVDGSTARTELTRDEAPVFAGEPAPGTVVPLVSAVRVGLGSAGEYLVARGLLAEERLRGTVAEATAEGRLDESWQNWSEPAQVEVAIPLGRPAEEQGRIYTFLPLGEGARAPLFGHLNAPFFTKVDRTALDREHPLNAVLFDALAETSLIAAAYLRDDPRPEFRHAAVDMIGWDPGDETAGLFVSAASRVFDEQFVDLPVLPVLDGGRGGWESIRQAVHWPPKHTTVLTAEAARRAGLNVIDPAIGPARLARLTKLCSWLRHPVEPGLEVLASHVEKIVSDLPRPGQREDVGSWNEVYTDIAGLFGKDGTVLQGRRLLLADDGSLRPCNEAGARGKAAGRDGFFAPIRGEDNVEDGLNLPQQLRKRMFLLHPGLVWRSADGRSLSQARIFLENNGLVRRFDAAGLLDHVKAALKDSTSRELRWQALKFVFRLHRSRRSSGSLSVRDVGLWVPSASGRLVEASTAVFGPGWQDTLGDDLAMVIAEGRDASSGLRWMEGLLLAPPQEFLGRGDTQAEWRDFLTAAGVQDGLLPCVTPNAVTRADGWKLTTDRIVSMAKVPPAVAEQWRPFIGLARSRAANPNTPYVAGGASRLPGQDVACDLTDPARLAYARLVLSGLVQWQDSHLKSVWKKDRPRDPDQVGVLTPLAAFVRGQPWLPVRAPDRSQSFVRPTDAWHCPSTVEEEPGFAPILLPQLRPLLRGEALTRLRNEGLPVWGAPADADRLLAFLGDLVALGTVADADLLVLRRANERAWRDLAEKFSSTPSVLVGDMLSRLRSASIVVETSGALSAVGLADFGAGSRTLYVSGDRDSVAARLIKESGQPLLVVPGDAQRVTAMLEWLCGQGVRPVDEAAVEVRVDGAVMDPHRSVPLAERLPWLPLALSLLVDHPRRGPRPSESVLLGFAAQVRGVFLHPYSRLEITLDGEPVPLPDRQKGVLPLSVDGRTVVLAEADCVEGLGWPSVEILAEAICHAVDQDHAGVHLKLAASRLGALHADPRALTDEEIAEHFDRTVAQVEETRNRLDGSVGSVVRRLRPVIVHVLGVDAASDVLDPVPESVQELRDRLESARPLPAPPDQLIAAARSARDVDDLRAAVDLDFAGFNKTLSSLAPDYRPTSRAAAHTEALQRYLALHRISIIDRLRWANIARFDAGEPIDGWRELCSLDWITVPGSWEFEIDSLDGAVLGERVEAAFSERFGSALPASGERLPAWEDTRVANTRGFTQLAPRLGPLLSALGHPVPDAFTGPDAVSVSLDRLDAVGALDFRVLSEQEILAWLQVIGLWPGGVATSADPADHGLTESDLNPGRREAERLRQEQVRAQRTVVLGGRAFDVGDGDFSEVVDALESVLEDRPDLLGGALRWSTPTAPQKRGRQSQTADALSGFTGRRRMSSAQRDAIGFIGEWFAFQWLQRHYKGVDESCWVSVNRRKVFPGMPGDDSLGYDFEVIGGARSIMFEVKATQGSGGRFELGESEVRAAQRSAGSDRWRLLVVTDVLDPEQLKVLMLPNPFSKEGRDSYLNVGGTLRFSYTLL
ncbi:sacsin N-terminal ATP-binding-like domain-containing protein [Actinocorallia populi]|uniref:sacsin N-terminal ATP-binding-like domain-containing protein n=1 Tax=Actinocorallia populi TaxID=2079200 RepID=UPI000D092002|nr:DUF3883 domain-containing protein [Actinocorallia populi]